MLPDMVVGLTIKCDWRGCKATIDVPCRHDAIEAAGWKQENYGLFSLHLCPEHRRHNWFKVREQLEKIEAPSSSHFMEGRGR
jgi:hypothetical protein